MKQVLASLLGLFFPIGGNGMARFFPIASVTVGVLAAVVVASLAANMAVGLVTLDNVQLNTDYDPPRPQNEPAVAFNVFDPLNAVAMANDRVPDNSQRGLWIGATTDGGRRGVQRQ